MGAEVEIFTVGNMLDNSYRIKRSFSRAAACYDRLTGFHQQIGSQLITRLEELGKYDVILDVGIGTGGFASLLQRHFSEAFITGIDLAFGMIEVAKQSCPELYILEADACNLPFKHNVFDLITSNLAYQWAADIFAAFHGAYCCLKKGGRFCFSMFGRKTLDELFISLSHAVGENLSIHRLYTLDDVINSLRSAGFTDINVISELHRIYFPDMMALLKWVKGIGANALKKDIFIGRRVFVSASHYYERYFSKGDCVYASMEVFWVNAVKSIKG